MILVDGACGHRRRALVRRARLLGLVAVLLTVGLPGGALLSGCSGGGNSSDTSINPPNGQTAQITGTIAESSLDLSTPARALANITISYRVGNGPTTNVTTNSNGFFLLNVPTNQNITVSIDAPGYRDTIRYSVNGSTFCGSRQATGFTVPSGAAGTVTSVGTILLDTEAAPPPPPCGF